MKYVCTVCGYIYDEEKEGRPFSELTECPMCRQPVSRFKPVEEDPAPAPAADGADPLAYDPVYARSDASARYMDEIHEMAVSGRMIDAAMGTQKPLPSWDEILLLGAQLDPAPLDDGAPVGTMTVLGKNAKQPMLLQTA